MSAMMRASWAFRYLLPAHHKTNERKRRCCVSRRTRTVWSKRLLFTHTAPVASTSTRHSSPRPELLLLCDMLLDVHDSGTHNSCTRPE